VPSRIHFIIHTGYHKIGEKDSKFSRPIFLIWRFKTLGFTTVAKGAAFCSRASSYIVKLFHRSSGFAIRILQF